MKARPILMSGPMVRANLEDRKTHTRRIVKPQPDWLPEVGSVRRTDNFFWPIGSLGQQCGAPITTCPYGKPGDLLWVREAWTLVPASAYRMSEGVQQTINPNDREMAAIYAAGWDRSIPKWRPSIHMPRWANRLTLAVEEIRVERLQDISEADALAEGVTIENVIVDTHCAGGVHSEITADRAFFDGGDEEGYETAVDAYQALWTKINGATSWDDNPWVWVIAYKPHKLNVDAFIEARAA